MGYRSSWKLAFAGEQKALCLLQDRLQGLASKQSGEADERRDIMVCILRCRDKNAPPHVLVYQHDSTKCYPPWDSVITELREHGRELGLETAYAQVGESLDDCSCDNDACDKLNLYVSRSIELEY